MSAVPGRDRPVRLCLVLGAPRSGTTLLQRLLAAGPRVVSPQESNLFVNYLAPQQRTWRAEVDRLEQALAPAEVGQGLERRVVGLPTLLGEDDLLDAQRLLLDRFLRRALDTKPSAELVVEKTPAHSRYVDVVDRVCPSARFVHIVRDPREVMASLRDAAAGWGRAWAPADPVAAARLWLRTVDAARQASVLGPDRYHEVRYEDLRAEPRAVLGGVLTFLDLPDDPGALVEAEQGAGPLELFALAPRLRSRLDSAGAAEPAGFRAAGRAPLGLAARRVADIVAGARARELGYTTGWDEVSRLALGAWSPPLHAVHRIRSLRRRALRSVSGAGGHR